VLIEGRLKLDRWEKDGQKHSKLKVVGDRLQMLGGRGEGGGKGRGRGGDESGGTYDESEQYSNVGAPPPSDDIPF
jgi:single-strand DNA-binding protein